MKLLFWHSRKLGVVPLLSLFLAAPAWALNITGTVFEDLNYGGGGGRALAGVTAYKPLINEWGQAPLVVRSVWRRSVIRANGGIETDSSETGFWHPPSLCFVDVYWQRSRKLHVTVVRYRRFFL